MVRLLLETNVYKGMDFRGCRGMHISEFGPWSSFTFIVNVSKQCPLYFVKVINMTFWNEVNMFLLHLLSMSVRVV